MRGLLLFFIVIPIVELWLLIKVGSSIGALSTIALVFLTAIVGVTLLRRQGLATLTRANQRMSQGELPAKEMAEGLFLAVGGALLLTPGFMTDIIGFCCLVPGLRHWVLGRFIHKMVMMKAEGRGQYAYEHHREHHSAGQGANQGANGTYKSKPDVIEGEYKRHD